MAEVPTHKDIHLCDGGQRNMEHVVFKPFPKDGSLQIACSQIERFGRHCQYFGAEAKQLSVHIANRIGRSHYFRRRYLRENGLKVAKPKIL